MTTARTTHYAQSIMYSKPGEVDGIKKGIVMKVKSIAGLILIIGLFGMVILTLYSISEMQKANTAKEAAEFEIKVLKPHLEAVENELVTAKTNASMQLAKVKAKADLNERRLESAVLLLGTLYNNNGKYLSIIDLVLEKARPYMDDGTIKGMSAYVSLGKQIKEIQALIDEERSAAVEIAKAAFPEAGIN